MNLSKEVKTGILALVAICLLVYGYSFLKGSSLFSNERTFYVPYKNVAGLALSAPVTVNGHDIGKVKNIDFINKQGGLIVTFTLDKEFDFSKSSIVEIYSTSFIGGNALAIIPDFIDNEIAKSGDTLTGRIQKGMLETVTSGLKPLEKRIYQTLSGLDTLLYNFNFILNDTTKGNLKEAIASLNKTMASFEGASANLDGLLSENRPKLDNTFSYLETTTGNLAQFSDSLSQVDIKNLAATLEETLNGFDSVMSKIDNGEGSIGKLINDEELYNNLESASKELEELLRDLKENPKRYVHISVFGKKAEPYESTEEDNN